MKKLLGSGLLTALGVIGTTVIIVDRVTVIAERIIRLYRWQDDLRNARRLRTAVGHAEVGD